MNRPSADLSELLKLLAELKQEVSKLPESLDKEDATSIIVDWEDTAQSPSKDALSRVPRDGRNLTRALENIAPALVSWIPRIVEILGALG